MTGGELYRYKKGIMSIMSMDMCIHYRVGRPMVLTLVKMLMTKLINRNSLWLCVCTKCIVKPSVQL